MTEMIANLGLEQALKLRDLGSSAEQVDPVVHLISPSISWQENLCPTCLRFVETDELADKKELWKLNVAQI